MNKSELVDTVASAAGVTKGQAENVLDAFFGTVTRAAKGGDKVAWPGFGSFSLSYRAARTGRNPQTGAPVKIAASRVMKFTASATLKSELNARGGAAKKAAPAKKAPAKKSGAKKAPAKKATKSAKKR